MRVIGKKFGKTPEVMEIGEELREIQEFVEGYIEIPFISSEFSNRGIVVVVNEEAIIKELKTTLALVRNDKIVGTLKGQYFFCSIDGDDFSSLNDEQIKFIMNNMVFNRVVCGDGAEIDMLDVLHI